MNWFKAKVFIQGEVQVENKTYIFRHCIQDEQNSKMMYGKLATLDQALKMEKRVRRKTQKFYKSRVESNKAVMDMGKNDKTAKGKEVFLNTKV